MFFLCDCFTVRHFILLCLHALCQVVRKTFAMAEGLEKKQLAYLLARQVYGPGQD